MQYSAWHIVDALPILLPGTCNICKVPDLRCSDNGPSKKIKETNYAYTYLSLALREFDNQVEKFLNKTNSPLNFQFENCKPTEKLKE